MFLLALKGHKSGKICNFEMGICSNPAGNPLKVIKKQCYCHFVTHCKCCLYVININNNNNNNSVFMPYKQTERCSIHRAATVFIYLFTTIIY